MELKTSLKNNIQQLLNLDNIDSIPDDVLNYIYTSLDKNDYSISAIQDILTADVIAEYDLSNTSDFTSISDIKEYYIKEYTKSSPELVETIKTNKELIGILTDIERDLKLLLDDLNTDDISKINQKLTELIAYENKGNIQSDIIGILENKLNLISVYDDINKKRPEKQIYIFSYKANSYIPYTIQDLELQLKNINKNVRLLPNTYKNLLSRVSTTDNIKKSYIEFENIYLDRFNYQVIHKGMDNIYFTNDRLYYDNDSSIKLYNYTSGITVDNLKDLDEIPYTIQVLQQITIPKTNPDDDSIFRFIIQLIGICLLGKNTLKMLPIFMDNGSKGKTTLVNILAILFKSGIETVNKKVFNDTFTVETLNNAKYCFVNDEFKFNEFSKYNNEYKLLAGAGFYSGRGFMSSDSKTVTDLPVTLLFTNDIPVIDLNDSALIQRMLIITLPNKFIANDGSNELKENEYYRNSNIINEIKSDYKGLSLLLSLAINEYQLLLQSGNIDKNIAFKQSENEKLSIISKQDPVLSFLIFNCKENVYNSNPKNYLSTDDIIREFTKWYRKIYNKNPPEVYTTDKQQLGYKIRNTFKGLKTKTKPARYNLIILSSDEAIKERNKIIEIIDDNYNGIDIENKIINLIKKGNNTKNKLLSELPDINDLELISIINNLDNQGVINITVTTDIPFNTK